MRTVFPIMILMLSLFPLAAQSVILPEGLKPFKINRVLVENPPARGYRKIRISGRNFINDRIPLFETREEQYQKTVTCYVYLDDNIGSIEVELYSAKNSPRAFKLPVERNPYGIGVFQGGNRVWRERSTYYPVSSTEELGPGDIYVLQGIDDLWEMEKLRNRGIHLIVSADFAPESKAELSTAGQGDKWRGSLLTLDPLDSQGLAGLLEEKKKELLRFKDRYRSLVTEADFHGIMVDKGESNTFTNARPADMAYTLEKEALSNRLSLLQRLILVGFYLPALILIASLKNLKILYPLVSGLLFLFIMLTLLYPGRDRILTLKLNPFHVELSAVRLERVNLTPQPLGLSPGPQEYQFTARSLSEDTWVFEYSMLYSYRRMVPMERLYPSKYIKCNQIPQFILSGGKYFAEYENPLKMWSLREPE